jgi:hypothetical protein
LKSETFWLVYWKEKKHMIRIGHQWSEVGPSFDDGEVRMSRNFVCVKCKASKKVIGSKILYGGAEKCIIHDAYVTASGVLVKI